MKLKSKYNIGSIVEFYNDRIQDYDIARIDGVTIEFSWERLQRNTYSISIFRKDNNYYEEIQECKIIRQLNKKAFEKAYAEKCAKELRK